MRNGSRGTGGLSIPSELIYARTISPVLTAHRFSEELSTLHTRFQGLLKQREDLESDLQRHYSTICLLSGRCIIGFKVIPQMRRP